MRAANVSRGFPLTAHLSHQRRCSPAAEVAVTDLKSGPCKEGPAAKPQVDYHGQRVLVAGWQRVAAGLFWSQALRSASTFRPLYGVVRGLFAVRVVAMPEPPSQTSLPGPSKIFPGLISQSTTSLSCRYCKAAIGRMMGRMVARGSETLCRNACATLPPLAYSIARLGVACPSQNRGRAPRSASIERLGHPTLLRCGGQYLFLYMEG